MQKSSAICNENNTLCVEILSPTLNYIRDFEWPVFSNTKSGGGWLKCNGTLFQFELNYIAIKYSHSSVIDQNFVWGHRVFIGEIAPQS